MVIPEKFRVGHEAHFGQVTNRFFEYVTSPKSMPAWETPYMLAKYCVIHERRGNGRSNEETAFDSWYCRWRSRAQESRREITNAAANPADDTKGLSDKVPDVYAMSTQFDRVVVLRFKFDTDLLAGLEKMVKQEKIRNAVILSGMRAACAATRCTRSAIATSPRRTCSSRIPPSRRIMIGMSGFIINGKHPPAHHAGDSGQGVRRAPGARHQRLHLRHRDHRRAEGRRGPEPRGRQELPMKAHR